MLSCILISFRSNLSLVSCRPSPPLIRPLTFSLTFSHTLSHTCLLSFFLSFLINYPLIYLHPYLYTFLLTFLITHSLPHFHACFLSYLLTYLLTYSLSLSLSLTLLITHSLTHSLTHLLTYSFPHFLPPSLPPSLPLLFPPSLPPSLPPSIIALRVMPLSLEVDSATIQLIFSDLISDLKYVDSEETVALESPEKWVRDLNMRLLSPSDRMALVCVRSSWVAAQVSQMYVEKFIIHPMKFTLTFVQTPFPRKTGKDTFKTTALNFLTSLAGVDRMQLKLKSFEVDDMLESSASLMDLLKRKTLHDLQSQLAEIAGTYVHMCVLRIVRIEITTVPYSARYCLKSILNSVHHATILVLQHNCIRFVIHHIESTLYSLRHQQHISASYAIELTQSILNLIPAFLHLKAEAEKPSSIIFQTHRKFALLPSYHIISLHFFPPRSPLYFV